MKITAWMIALLLAGCRAHRTEGSCGRAGVQKCSTAVPETQLVCVDGLWSQFRDCRQVESLLNPDAGASWRCCEVPDGGGYNVTCLPSCPSESR